MAKPNRIARSKEELKHELIDQLQLLRLGCENYDRGIDVAAKDIATRLRVLLHMTGRSRALLDQLGYRTGRFHSTNFAITRDHYQAMPLLGIVVGTGNVEYKAKIQLTDITEGSRKLPFDEWWSEPILRPNERITFTRMEIVLHVADTDGGAHVDEGLDEAYMETTRKNAAGWMVGSTGLPPGGKIELACVRQIAHELLVTLHTRLPEFSQHAEPVVPDSARGAGPLDASLDIKLTFEPSVVNSRDN